MSAVHFQTLHKKIVQKTPLKILLYEMNRYTK